MDKRTYSQAVTHTVTHTHTHTHTHTQTHTHTYTTHLRGWIEAESLRQGYQQLPWLTLNGVQEIM
jgi:hypothetical protein